MTDINRLKVLAESLVIRAGSAGPDISADFLGLIAEVERLNARLKAENYAYKDTQKRYEWLAEDLKECASTLPGTYYMDPQVGGNVSIPEQIRRMAKDAARYRALRQKQCGDVVVRDRASHLFGEHLDAAIDAAIEGAKQ
ncbi:TPA: hypothetical protein MX426_004507 [Pseudomonas aeruginosa]|nr:hypothetical protein [Pseudomonas aeruginosa]